MFALAVEYGHGLDGLPDQAGRGEYRALLARQPGYRRRLELQDDGWRRVVDLFLFASPEAALAAFDSADRRAFAASHPACRDTAPALLVRDAGALGAGPVVLLRRTPRASPTGAQCCWRDHLHPAAPVTELW